MDLNDYFISSLSLEEHPMKISKLQKRKMYYNSLKYFLTPENKYDIIAKRLEQYRLFLIGSTVEPAEITLKNIKNFLFFHKKLRLWLICDMALILLDRGKVERSVSFFNSHFSKFQSKVHQNMLTALIDLNANVALTREEDYLVTQYRKNREFLEKKTFRCIVTANISAGKSTFINAMIGKPLARTAAGACTGNMCYFYNKAFEDEHTHLAAPSVSLSADRPALSSFPWDCKPSVASYFRNEEANQGRVCIIDTPGVDHARDKHQGEITREALLNEKYDKLIYVLEPTRSGTEPDVVYITWIAQNIPKDKVIFVLNKMDELNYPEDNIDQCIDSVRKDLIGLGYENPVLCPISCKFALFMQIKQNGDSLSEMQRVQVELTAKSFQRIPAYNLSKYYPDDGVQTNDEYRTLLRKCGLYGLVKILFGGQQT